MGVLAVGYSVPRFFLDFLRARDLPFVDGRILGLTPAQYLVIVWTALGIWLLATASRRSESVAASEDQSAGEVAPSP